MNTKFFYLSLFLTIVVLGVTIFSASEQQSNCVGQRLPDLEKQNEMLECAVLIDDELIFPRNIAVHKADIWLIDKGNNLFENDQKNGNLYQYKRQGNGYSKHLILENLADSNDVDIRYHGDGSVWLYLTTRRTVQRLNISSPNLDANKNPEIVIDNIPTGGWHKLLAIEVSQDHLLLTVPSSTDHCELAYSVSYPCFEESNSTAQIRQYDFNGDDLSEEFTVVASGLRNASATQLIMDNSKLIVADNGWDQVDLIETDYQYTTTPHDEINIIDLTKHEHFGWPYCFDNTLITPPYRHLVSSCGAYKIAHVLLPAHSAPLNMMYFSDKLLVNLHGNNELAAKTVAFSLDKDGLPIKPFQVNINWNIEGSSLGRPMGLAKLAERELLVTDDWNHQLIKLVFKSD